MNLAETAYAKINLALHVRCRRADGYHDIETLFAFADFGDILTAAPADGISLRISGAFAAGLPADKNNLVIQAAEALARCHDVKSGAAIALDKRLPVASGIGGGSADAAAALRLLNRLWGVGADDAALAGIARTLGADVPACVFSRSARGEGAGERLSLLGDAGLTGRDLVLVNPLQPVATGAVFAGWDGVDRGPLADFPPLAAAAGDRNDLERPAVALCPAIGDVLDLLSQQSGTERVRMSGSGATCFAIFVGEADAVAAAKAIRHARPSWWCARGKLL